MTLDEWCAASDRIVAQPDGIERFNFWTQHPGIACDDIALVRHFTELEQLNQFSLPALLRRNRLSILSFDPLPEIDDNATS